MILLLDNLDSFTHNVVHALAGVTTDEIRVVRIDAGMGVDELLALEPERIVISPGPGSPDGATLSVELIHAAAERGIPLLGICLGMQCIGAAFGGRIKRLDHVVHGSASPVRHDSAGVFAGMPQDFLAGRYHSLVVDEGSLPDMLEAVAHTDDGVLMALRHRTLPVHGVQFHPESILTPQGSDLLARFLDLEVAA